MPPPFSVVYWGQQGRQAESFALGAYLLGQLHAFLAVVYFLYAMGVEVSVMEKT
jgi:hypothetical protein